MKKINCLISIGVLKWQPLSKWALPSFIIPKKDYTVRTLSDFRELNKQIVRKPHPIPKISTTLQELEGFKYATTLNLNMSYYTIRLDPTVAKICTIIFPWGKYSYQRLPMGFARSADIFQAEMGSLMATLEYIRAYIDDLLIITKGSFDDHLDKLKLVFYPIARCRTKSQCNQVPLLCAGDRIFRVHPHHRWNLTTTKKGASNLCAQSSQ